MTARALTFALAASAALALALGGWLRATGHAHAGELAPRPTADVGAPVRGAPQTAAAGAGAPQTAAGAGAPQTAAAGAGAPQAGSLWSSPATLEACAATGGPRVVFPSDSPSHATGPGALVWSAGAGCAGGEGARVARVGPGDLPGPGAAPRTSAGRPLAPRGTLLATGAPHGQILIAGAAGPDAGAGSHVREAAGDARGAAGDGALVVQGAAGGPFAALALGNRAQQPLALATAYLGDVTLATGASTGSGAAGAGAGGASTGSGAGAASTGSGGAGAGAAGRRALRVYEERFFQRAFARTTHTALAAGGRARPRAVTLAMDFRGEALLVWSAAGGIYARLITTKGGPPPAAQRLAPAHAHVHLAAVLSDDRRGIVAFSEQLGEETAVYVDRSALGVRFGAPQLLERFRDPHALSAPAASPTLVRLSSESVVLAWAGAAAGEWVVRVAPVHLDGVGARTTIAAQHNDALLAALAPGPAGEAMLLWSQPLAGAAGAGEEARQQLLAARGFPARPRRVPFAGPEQVAAPGPVQHAALAFDPGSDRAIAAWQGEAGRIEYAVRAAQPRA
ncbi:MAG TPA: hypothetical protein VL979_13215 [Solirubrobacteraceae bacterium]|nr:hypothetical protein [Solirubrobacteraceae bacterium]